MSDMIGKLCSVLPSCRPAKIARYSKRHLSIQLTLLFCVSFPVTNPPLTHGDCNAFLLQKQTKCWNFYVLEITRKLTNTCASSENREKETMMLEENKFLSDLQKALVCKTQKTTIFFGKSL